MIDRRNALKLALGSAAMLASPVRAQGTKPRTRIVFLGTKGGPRVGNGASNPANLVVVNDTPFVIDCGMGVSRQLVSAGVPIPSVKYIFISHHHSDHNLEYGNLFYNAWAAGLSTPIHSFGPKGIEAMTKEYWELNKFDVETRIEDEGRPDPRKLLIAKDITDDGVVLKTADVTVTAFRTPHPPITDNFAYKFETPDGTIVFSSDTAYNPKLAEFAKGADVLVHECLYVPAVDRLVAKTRNGATLKKHLLDSHTSTEDVGRIAAAAGVKTLVLSHFVPGDDPNVTDDDWTRDVKTNFSGRIVVAKDLMELKLPE
ncbi:MBL fold metallo-hydrolase [Bradyrhizobium septentrionale]|uniref:MBL fold metallo-hydrolase n=1 Tax=Bradyrhizobium septentrionale TaxID=1404411 RepID=A0A973WAC6_9BRAD|nr:MBL fold metallo-hydrolase [Bradyrhizobium septentrionale]UGY18776.1 MBL fold metallo-hydrolase [Bradyrhizobium septentrionale]UGY27507.1 MBL fold metallo-hydrolase [Bradyrhizobium septentrionale]